MTDETRQLDYARPPKPMSRGRLALLVGAAAGVGIVIGGVTYAMRPPAPRAVVMGDIAAPAPAYVPQSPGEKAPTSQPEK